MAERHITALPGAVTRYRDDIDVDGEAQVWTTTSVPDPTKSHANLLEHTMAYSDIDDEYSRLYLLRELTRTRVSYNTPEQLEYLQDRFDMELVENVENYRLGCLMETMGYDRQKLVDSPMHKFTAQRLASVGTPEAYNQLLTYASGLFETKAYNQIISAVRPIKPDWAKALREIANRIKNGYLYRFSEMSAITLGSTRSEVWRSEVEFPLGFHYVLMFLESLEHYKNNLVEHEAMKEALEKAVKEGKEPGESEELTRLKAKFAGKMDGEKEIPGELELPDKFETGEYGQFAPLTIDEDVHLTKTVKGYLHRRKRSNFYGKKVVYPSRMLTDPQKRIFAEKVRAPGGIVIIDVSGSMSLNTKDVEDILDAAPGAVVAAYSHSSMDGVPNFTILANRGKQVETLPRSIFRGGNGVDGPALLWGLAQRHRKEPLIWVCDGAVTSAGDGMVDNLTDEIARLVMRYGIVQIPNVPMAVDQLKTRRFRNVPVGPVGERIMKIRKGTK